MTQAIRMGRQYYTREGRPVRILCTDGNSKTYPVVGFIGDDVEVHCWDATGKFLRGCDSQMDLVPVK